MDRIADMDRRQAAETAAGAIVSMGVHWLSHVAYLEASGIDWHQNGCREKFAGSDISNRQRAWMGRAGFLGQLAGGFILSRSRWSTTRFALGYNMATACQVITYPLHYSEYGDFEEIDRAGDRDLEYALYSAASLWLLDIDYKNNNGIQPAAHYLDEVQDGD